MNGMHLRVRGSGRAVGRIRCSWLFRPRRFALAEPRSAQRGA